MRRRGQLLNREKPVEDEVIDLTDRLAPYEHSAYRVQSPERAVEPVAPAPSFLELHPWRPVFPTDRPVPDEPAEAPADTLEPITLVPEALDEPAAPPVVQEAEDLDPVVTTLPLIAQEPEDLDPVITALPLIAQEPDSVDPVITTLPPVAQEPDDPDPVAIAAVPAPEELEDLDAVLAELVRDEAEALEAAMGPATAEVGARTAGPKQPRNEPCACGSGRKYKRCCGQKPATSQPLP